MSASSWRRHRQAPNVRKVRYRKVLMVGNYDTPKKLPITSGGLRLYNMVELLMIAPERKLLSIINGTP